MKALVIGFGSIGKRHALILSQLEHVVEVHIVSKQDIGEYCSFHSLKDVENLNTYDYFVIASITSKHVEQLNYIDKRVINKIILVEKPLATSFVTLNCRNQVFVGYNLRFHPILKKVRKLISTEKVLSVQIHTGQYLPTWRPTSDYRKSYSASRNEGGVLLDLSHELDYLIWLFGNIVKLLPIKVKISDLEIDTEDYFSAIGMTTKGTMFNISLDYISKRSRRQIYILTNQFDIEADLVGSTIKITTVDGNSKEFSVKNSNRNCTYREMHKQALGINNPSELATLQDSYSLLKIIDDINKKVES